MTIRVVLGEDSYLTREGITRVLAEEDDVEVVATCGDLDSLREAVDEAAPDVVLTDIRMPPTNTDEGIEFAAELRGTHPGLGVVVLSQYAEPVYAAQLLEGGSERRAYLLKDRVQDRGELSRALHEVADGRSVIDPRIVEELLAAQHRREHSQLDVLTNREQEILGLVAEGLSNQAISERLVITKRAVERHIHSIFWKLDLGNSEQISRRVSAALLYLAGEGPWRASSPR
ncbi:MAG: response regulator transcription factor [Solirubrobacteraceae bacterium]